MNKDIMFLDNFVFMLEIYKKIMEGDEIPLRELKMVSSRYSGKTHHMETLFALLFIQNKKRIVMNYVRARGEDAFKAMDTMESQIRILSNNSTYLKTNTQKKKITGHKNKINFFILNELKDNVAKNGGKIGVSIEYSAEYIITFYEECSQLEQNLVENFRHSVRGNEYTKKLFVYASNPWSKKHWLMEDFSKRLPENASSEKELEEKGYNSFYDPETFTLYYRPRWTRNTFLDKRDTNEIELMKEVNYNKWRIVSLGFSGTLQGSLYQASLQKLDEKPTEDFVGQYFGGVDWGDGKSANASPSTAYIGKISMEDGINILEEFEHWNNKGEVLSTDDQIKKICKFFIKWYEKVQQQITIYVDNAALGDFFQMCNTILRKMGYYGSQLEFLPAFKPKNTWERVEVVNVLLSLGILKFKRDVCPGLYDALDNCYEVIKTNPTEEMKRTRSHEWTHWIHALEYLIGSYFKEFQMRFPILIGDKSFGNSL